MVPIDYVSVLIGAGAAVVIGFLWYGPLFGKKWALLVGINPDTMKPSAKGIIGMVVTSLLMSYVLAHSFVFASAYLQISGLSAGLEAGFWSWVGFVAPVTVGVVLWENKPWTLWFINGGYYLVSLLVMGVVFGLWG